MIKNNIKNINKWSHFGHPAHQAGALGDQNGAPGHQNDAKNDDQNKVEKNIQK